MFSDKISLFVLFHSNREQHISYPLKLKSSEKLILTTKNRIICDLIPKKNGMEFYH